MKCRYDTDEYEYCLYMAFIEWLKKWSINSVRIYKNNLYNNNINSVLTLFMHRMVCVKG